MTLTRQAFIKAINDTDAGKSIHSVWSRWQCSACSNVVERNGHATKPTRKCHCGKGRWKRCTMGIIKVAETDVEPTIDR